MPLPQTEVPGRLQAELMSRGLRMTRQRRTILSVVETAKQDLDASQILRHARRLDPHIDRVTVYRTLGTLNSRLHRVQTPTAGTVPNHLSTRSLRFSIPTSAD
jgi:Fe2+ or Zn2+ uptake regulation protein